MQYDAMSLYGGLPPAQPSGTMHPGRSAGEPPVMARTAPSRSPIIGNPTMLLVAMLGLAIGIVKLSARVELG